MFRTVFIANRGEVAARVARTCKRLGIRVVAGVSEPDADLAWLRPEAGLVDAVAVLGGRQSYLDVDAILAVLDGRGPAPERHGSPPMIAATTLRHTRQSSSS